MPDFATPPRPPRTVFIDPNMIPETPARRATTLFSPSAAASVGADSTGAEASRQLVLEQVECLARMSMDGTLHLPFIVNINPDKPTTNWGFEAQQVSSIAYNNYMRNVYHIRKSVQMKQANDWTAYVPLEAYPTLAHRCIMIRGPCQDYWHASAALYHQNKKRMCEVTKKAHEVLETKLKKSPELHFHHWLLVFPEDKYLVNTVMSNDPVDVLRTINGLTDHGILEEGKPNEEHVEIFGTDIFWRIALAGGDQIHSPDKTETGDRYGRRCKPFHNANSG